MTRSRIALLVVLFLLCGAASAQSRYAIQNARIVTVSGNPIERGTVLIEDGLVSAVGARVSIPRGTEVIDGRNLSVYPGLFNSNTTIGLTEIGSVAVTSDNQEMGEFMPHLLAFSAFHIESEHIPVARVDGITHILSRPSGGILPGQGALMHMDGWSHEELEINRRGALIMSLPVLLGGGGRRGRRGGGGSYTQAKQRFDEKIVEIKELFERARYYGRSRQDGLTTKMDRQLEALEPALNGEQVVLLEANSHVDIQEAVKFAQSEKLNYVILGGRDAWKIPDFLRENNVRLILGPTQNLPSSEDDHVSQVYRAPGALHAAGIRFAFATGGNSNARTLPFEVGNAVAHGLPYDVALRSITLTPAEFFGVGDKLGSIETGKIANLVVTDGDILEYQTKIHHIFIKGKPISLDSKHTLLYEKYRARPN